MALGHLKQDPDLWNRGTRRAYVIGASAYGPPIPSLVTPRGDARDVGDLLASAHGYRVTRLHEGNVGLGEVLALLGQMKAEVRAEDRVLFYFAGHGVPPDSDASKAGYLLPETAVRNEPGTFLSMDMLYEHLAALPCRHLLVILDCCFAGSFRWARTRPQRFFDAIPERRIYVERVRQFLGRRAWQLVTSAGSGELASDILFGQRPDGPGHSPFAAALLDGLAGKADLRADGGRIVRDGVITLRKLVDYLSHRMMQVTARQTVGYYPLEEHEDGEFLFLAPGVDARTLELPSVLPGLKERNPYLGLDSYDYSGVRARRLYGRDAARAELAGWVAQRPLTVAAGASGAGKSSLVRAGRMPDLAATPGWVVVPPLRPGTAPLQALSDALAQVAWPAGPLGDGQAPAPHDPLAVLSAWSQGTTGGHVLLCVDQFEDLVTQSVDVDEAARFCDLVLAATRLRHVHAVLVVRSDYERRFQSGAAALSVLGPGWADARYAIPAMSDEDLRAVIQGPANERAVAVAQPVVDALVREAGGQPWRLPLLAATLEQLYDQCVERLASAPPVDWVISSDDYRAVGGVEQAVIGRFERLHIEVSGAGADLGAVLRRVLLRMVNQDGRVLGKRQVARSEFQVDGADEAGRAENCAIEQVLRALASARLVVADRQVLQAGQELESLELIHDSVIHQWQPLAAWIDEANQSLPIPLKRRLTQDAIRWHHEMAAGQVARSWATHPDLPLAWDHLQREPFAFNEVEARFLQASHRQGEVARRRTGFRATLVVLVLAVLALGVGVALNQLRQREVDLGSRQLAAQAAMIGSVKPDVAALLSVHALRQRPGSEAKAAVLREVVREPRLVGFLPGQAGDVEHLAFSPDGAILATASSASERRPGRVVVWDVASGRTLASEPVDGQAMKLATGAGSRHVAISLAGGAVRLLDLSTGRSREWKPFPSGMDFEAGLGFSRDGRHLIAHNASHAWKLALDDLTESTRDLTGHDGDVTVRLEFSPDGRTVYSGGGDGRVLRHRWEATRAEPISGPGVAVTALALDPTTGSLAVGRDNGAVSIHVAGSTRPRLMRRADGRSIRKLKFNADGRTLAESHERRSGPGEELSVWSLSSGRGVEIAVPRVLHDFSISKGSEHVGVAGIDSYVHVHATADGRLQGAPLQGQAQSVYAIEFSPRDPAVLATSGDDGVVILWDMSRLSPLSEPVGGDLSSSAIEGLSYAAAGELVGGAGNGMLFLRSANGGDVKVWHSGVKDQTFSQFGFSADGRLVVAGGETDGLAVFDLRADARPRYLQAPGGSRALRVGAAGDVVHSLDTGGKVHVIRLSDGAELASQPLDPETSAQGLVPMVAVPGPGGRQIALGYENGDVFVGPLDGGRFRELLRHAKRVTALAYTPDGAVLVSAGQNTVGLTEVDTGRPLATLLENHQSAVVSLAVSSSGRLLAVGCVDGSIVLFDIEAGQQLGTLQGHVDAVHALAFQPGADVLVSGGLDRRVLEWRLGVETLVDKARRIAGRNLSAAEWRQYVGPGVPYERAFDSLPDGEGVTPADRHASGSATRALIGAALVAWIPLMLVVPWWSVRQSMRRTGLFVLYPVAIGAVLVAALQQVAFVPGVNSVTLDLGLRALAMIAIAVAAAWAQKFLELHPTWVRPRPRRR